jgi:hypothetical protein
MQTTHRLALVLAASLVSASAHAQITNGGFATDLAGWSSAGDVAHRDGTAFLTTASLAGDDDGFGPAAFNFSGSEVVSSGDIEALLSFPAGALDPDAGAGVFAFEGSLLYRNVSVQAGDVLSFYWNFYSNDAANDYAFVLFDALTFNLTDGLTRSATGDYGFSLTTGAGTFTSAPASETRTISFAVGILDTGDFNASSALAIDNVTLTAIPEPSTYAALAGLAVLGLAASRRRRA